jgi:hypothetical protein
MMGSIRVDPAPRPSNKTSERNAGQADLRQNAR